MAYRVDSLYLLPALACLSAAACGEGPGTDPGTLRFGQIGEVRLHLTTPLGFTYRGELQQSLTWSSSGPWRLTEAISYDGRAGDENERPSTVNPELLAGTYADWILRVNETTGLRLFDLDSSLDPECEGDRARTRISLTISDAVRDEERTWVRCVAASRGLGDLVTQYAGPDPNAARVANAALLLKEYTVEGTGFFRYSFDGTVPFATLARGEDTPAPLETSRVIEDDVNWRQFWLVHTGSEAGLPEVDFGSELVLVAAVGVRDEAGDSVEIRQILPVGETTNVEVVERVPGNFCSPVRRFHRPFHIVVAPRVPLPVTFLQLPREEVPCGV